MASASTSVGFRERLENKVLFESTNVRFAFHTPCQTILISNDVENRSRAKEVFSFISTSFDLLSDKSHIFGWYLNLEGKEFFSTAIPRSPRFFNLHSFAERTVSRECLFSQSKTRRVSRFLALEGTNRPRSVFG